MIAKFDVHGVIGQIGVNHKIVQGRIKQDDLCRAPYRRQQEYHASMNAKIEITSSKLDRIVRDKCPTFALDHVEYVPIFPFAKAEMIDVRGGEAARVGKGGQFGGEIFVDEKT